MESKKQKQGNNKGQIGSTLSEIVKFTEFVKSRASDLVNALELNVYGVRNEKSYNFTFEDIDYSTNRVDLIFKEITSHDCPETGYITVSAECLSLSDDEWNSKIGAIKMEKDELRDNRKEARNRESLDKKMEKFYALKKELDL